MMVESVCVSTTRRTVRSGRVILQTCGLKEDVTSVLLWVIVSIMTRRKESYLVFVLQSYGRSILILKKYNIVTNCKILLFSFRMCVRIEERTPEEEVLATDIASAEEQNTTDSSVERSSFVLGNRIPKIWEFTTTTEAPVSDEEASDKEMAYGLKGIEDPVAIRATAVENLIFAVNELNSSEIERLGYDKREFITKCSFNGRQCSIEE